MRKLVLSYRGPYSKSDTPFTVLEISGFNEFQVAQELSMGQVADITSRTGRKRIELQVNRRGK